MITGGMDCSFPIYAFKQLSYDITEIVDLSTRTSRIAGSLNTPRQNHGMSVMTIGRTFRLIAFGGESVEGGLLLDSTEMWNSQTETWEEVISKKFKLKEKISRFSTLTIFNCPRPALSVSLPLPEDELRPFTPLDIYQGTREKEHRQINVSFKAPMNILLMVCLICRLLPKTLWWTLVYVAWYELIVKTSCLSLSKLIEVKNSQHCISSFANQLLIPFNQLVIVLPRTLSKGIDQFVQYLTQVPIMWIVPLTLSLFSFMYSRGIYFWIFKVKLDKMYHETLQAILFLSFEKIHSILINFNNLSKNISFLQKLTKIITDPIASLLIIGTLMYSEQYLRIVSITIFSIHVISFYYYCQYDEINSYLKSFNMLFLAYVMLCMFAIFTLAFLFISVLFIDHFISV